MDPKTTQLLRGTLDVLLLRTLAGNELHGYAIAARIAERTDGVLG
jgi:DNA-binding PadR family transcriptional regulator